MTSDEGNLNNIVTKSIQVNRKINSLIKENQWREARDVLSKHLSDFPGDAESHHRMVRILSNLSDSSGALESCTRAHNIAPNEPRFLLTLSHLYARMNDKETALRFRKKAEELEPIRLQAFEHEQTDAKALALEGVRSALARCLPGWRYANSQAEPGTPIADRLMRIHYTDQTAFWPRYIPQRYDTGDIVMLDGVGRFVVGNINHTIQKRLARGMPWELQAVVFFMELAARCDDASLMIDIGANVGTHTVPIAKTFKGPVLAFEPVPLTHALLLENLFLNNIKNCIPSQKACGGAPGNGRMIHVEERNPGKAQLDTSSPAGVEISTLDVEVARLGRPVSFIKIDVEGHEADVFKGGMETIRRDHPIIFCEILGHARSVKLAETFSDIGYELHPFSHHDWLLIPK